MQPNGTRRLLAAMVTLGTLLALLTSSPAASFSAPEELDPTFDGDGKLLSMLAAANAAGAAPDQPQAGWVTILSEDFESAFPTPFWHIGREGDPYLWGQRDCNPHRGRYSMWGGGGGSLGSQTPCMGMYTTGYVTTLSYGPFDLSGSTDLRLNFAHWTWLGAGDSLGVGFSIDGGKSWNLVPITGNAVAICKDWCEEVFSKDRWGIPLVGQPKVYLLFRFASNAENVSYGAFVDDVSLEAYYDITPPATPTSTPPPGGDKRIYLPLILR